MKSAGSRLATLVLAPMVLMIGWASPSAAWTPSTRVAMAEAALLIAPPDFERQISKHKRRFREGITTAAQADVAGRSIDEVIQSQTDATIRAIINHQPFSDIVFQAGVVSYFVASANNPVMTAGAGQPTQDHRFDYFRYLQSASGRFPVLYYGEGRDIENPEALSTLIGTSVKRSRKMAPMIASEYKRIGTIDGVNLFDDRSTAFGVGSLAYSHAVSDMAGVLRYIWIAAGGIDTRGLPQLDNDHLILVSPGEPVP